MGQRAWGINSNYIFTAHSAKQRASFKTAKKHQGKIFSFGVYAYLAALNEVSCKIFVFKDFFTAQPAPASGFANNRLTQERQETPRKDFFFSEDKPENKKLDACGRYSLTLPEGLLRIVFRGSEIQCSL